MDILVVMYTWSYRVLTNIHSNSFSRFQIIGKGKGKGGRGEKKAVSRSAKAGLQFPVGRIGRFLKQGKYSTRIGGKLISSGFLIDLFLRFI